MTLKDKLIGLKSQERCEQRSMLGLMLSMFAEPWGDFLSQREMLSQSELQIFQARVIMEL